VDKGLDASSPRKGAKAFRLRPPASACALDALEALVKLPLPQDLRDLYAHHDGQSGEDDPCFFPFGTMLSTTPMGQIWQAAHENRHIPAQFDESYENGRIREVVGHPGWLPLIDSPCASETIVLDFIPGPNGTLGQILYPVNECELIVIGKSLGHFCQRWLALLESNAIPMDEDGNLEDYEGLLRFDAE